MGAITCTHHHGGHHVSTDEATRNKKRLLVAMFINLVIPVLQIAGGLYAGSMALVADATHNLSDFASLIISYVALIIASRGASATHTFGFKRAEVLAACANVILLLLACTFIVKEAFERFMQGGVVLGSLVIWLALLGIVGNGLSAWILSRGAEGNINIRGAFLHMVADMLTSVGVLIVGLTITIRPWFWLDPLISLVIVIFILRNCWQILKESIQVLMDAVPLHIDLKEVKRAIENVPGVISAHYLHAWSISPGVTAFSCHVVVPDTRISELRETKERIENMLASRFAINHPVLQFEAEECGNGSLLCELSCTSAPGNPDELENEEPKSPRSKGFRIFGTLMRIAFGGVFVWASYDKILNPREFAEVVYNYMILPDEFINIVAIILPWIELFTGLSLIFGIFTRGSLLISIALLIVFTGAIVANIIRGIDISCGCFTTDQSEASQLEMWLDVLRDIGLIIWAGWLFRQACLAKEMPKESARGKSDN
ncbi:cation diffusion facilitator family transporter [Thermodesulforhabdus norvegica]|uniref:Cation diffusion facilitator family transporter n=1 Tax=Thermodesulforhabdus norvegica TaxID=39841 RepID=A0A1I4V7T2_9BACT|nr:cation diffusion facilitator family transporter [Thermodesulforhabdus norvegica]SFM97208.1 cation diffusion facilitator family transporter [Thermodesulforhabdus norvegica]